MVFSAMTTTSVAAATAAPSTPTSVHGCGVCHVATASTSMSSTSLSSTSSHHHQPQQPPRTATTTTTTTSYHQYGQSTLPHMLSELNFENKVLLRQRPSNGHTNGSSSGDGITTSKTTTGTNKPSSSTRTLSTTTTGNARSGPQQQQLKQIQNQQHPQKERRSLFSSFRDGLFCLSYLDESEHDLFYDAVQDPNSLPPQDNNDTIEDDIVVGKKNSGGSTGRRSKRNSTKAMLNGTTATTSTNAPTSVSLSLRGGGSDHNSDRYDPIQNATEWGQEVQHYASSAMRNSVDDPFMSSYSTNYFTPHSSSTSLAGATSDIFGMSNHDPQHNHQQPTMYFPPQPGTHPHQFFSTRPSGGGGGKRRGDAPPHPTQQSNRQHTGSTITSAVSSNGGSHESHNPFARKPSPPAPPVSQLPDRFLRAGKGDVEEGKRRYQATLDWRREHNIDGILLEPHPQFNLIKQHYPHYYHCRGYNNEPVFFEQPPKTNLQALKSAGIDLDGLVRHYTMVTEFQWQFIEPSDDARSITVLDLDGIRMMDFVGECVEYVRKCSHFTGQHYPERAGHVIVIGVPRWFSMIWNVVKPMVDEVTLKKISIVRGKNEVFQALVDKIPIENIPKEYGGQSKYKLGSSPEETALRDLMAHNNALANGDFSCGGRAAKPPCKFCSWGPVRSY